MPRASTTSTILAALLAVFAAPALASAAPAFGPAPFASGDSAANIALDGAATRVLVRWVPHATGVVQRLHLRVKLAGSRCSPGGGRYAGGDGGVLEARTYRVNPSGLPTGPALRHVRIAPCAVARDGTIALTLALPVRSGREYATVVANAAIDPATDFFSLNFLFEPGGVQGANGRNERLAGASDALYGLDPRELVGYSRAAGSNWSLPGGPYGGRGGRAFLPSYLLQWRSGEYTGQPFYYSSPVYGDVAMSYRAGRRPWTIRGLGAHTFEGGAAQVTLYVNGTRKAVAVLRGTGELRARIRTVVAPPGAVVRVVTRSGWGGLALRRMHADALWSGFLGLGSNERWFAAAPRRGDPVTVFPLPAPP